MLLLLLSSRPGSLYTCWCKCFSAWSHAECHHRSLSLLHVFACALCGNGIHHVHIHAQLMYTHVIAARPLNLYHLYSVRSHAPTFLNNTCLDRPLTIVSLFGPRTRFFQLFMLPACAQYVHRIDHFEAIRWTLPSCANACEDKLHKSQDAHSCFSVYVCLCVYFAGADDQGVFTIWNLDSFGLY